jgi:hypothetical protein
VIVAVIDEHHHGVARTPSWGSPEGIVVPTYDADDDRERSSQCRRAVTVMLLGDQRGVNDWLP